MAPVRKTKTIEHFTHPGHVLAAISTNKEYLCGGCRTPGGAGTRFRCNHCDFNLHEYCGSCPSALSSFMHPQHPMSLVVRTQGERKNQRICDVCGDSVEGLFYRCKQCEFDVHPVCTQLPQYLRHALHPSHQLRLQPSAPGWCAVCRSVCSYWRYRCEACCFDIHLECVVLAPPKAASTSSSIPPTGPPPHFYGAAPPPYGAYGYGVPPGFSPQWTSAGAAQGSHIQPSKEKKLGKFMFALVGKLTIGVVSNVVFGLAENIF